MSRGLWLALAGLGALAVACDSGPKAGELAYDFVTPENDDRAVVFTVTAAQPFMITGVLANCAGCRVFPHKVSDTDWRGVLTGMSGNGPALRIAVSDRKETEAYAVMVNQVAGADYGVRSRTGRRMELAR